MRKAWQCNMMLGFFRRERPVSEFVVIPAETVSQMKVARRGGIFNRGEYLVIVEGDEMESGFMKRVGS